MPRPIKHDFNEMRVGESRVLALIYPEQQRSIRKSATRYGKTFAMVFSCRAIPGGFQITRTE